VSPGDAVAPAPRAEPPGPVASAATFLADEPASADDAAMVARINEGLARGDWRWAPVAMLFVRASRLTNPPLDLTRAPDWFRLDWLSFLLETPVMFTEIGDADAHARHTRRVLERLHAEIMARRGEALWQELAKAVVPRVSVGLLYFTDDNLEPVARIFGDLVELTVQLAGHPIDDTFAPRTRQRIRIGVIAQHFQAETGPFSTLAMFKHLDRAKFELIMYATRMMDSPAQRVCFERADRIEQVSENVADTAAKLRRDDLDLLLLVANLAPRDNFWAQLGVHRLARVQFVNFVTPMTTGIPNIDYFISGTLSEPAEAQAQYREKLVLLDGVGFCYDLAPQRAMDAASPQQHAPVTRAMLGIDPAATVFASGANFYKLVPELLHTWAKILAAVPNSAMVLYPFSKAWGDQYAAERLYEQIHRVAAANGAQQASFVLAPPLPGRGAVQNVLRSLADVYLDSFPHSGANSLLDALEIGLPAVTLYGKTLRGRHGGGMMIEMGVAEGVTESIDAYIELAVRLGRNRDARAALRARIEAQIARGPRFLDTRWHGEQCAALYEKFIAEWESASARS
jgi:predicted O-linked N-acetylglucosamine transferase (SPINDLY family)